MARRSTRLLRFENSLYKYNKLENNWVIDPVNFLGTNNQLDILEKGTYATCKHMSQKVNPILLRRGFLNTWSTALFIDYRSKLVQQNLFYFDFFVRNYIKSVLIELNSILNKIEIKQVDETFFIKVYYFTSNNVSKRDTEIRSDRVKRFKKLFPALKAENMKEKLIYYNPFFVESAKDLKEKSFFDLDTILLGDHLENFLAKLYQKRIKISFHKHKSVGESATLISEFLANQIEKSNANFKRALRETFKEIVNKNQIKGIRINCSGRLGKAPMAKTEWFKYGQIPLSRINSSIDYSHSTSSTKYGSIGTKVWVYYY